MVLVQLPLAWIIGLVTAWTGGMMGVISEPNPMVLICFATLFSLLLDILIVSSYKVTNKTNEYPSKLHNAFIVSLCAFFFCYFLAFHDHMFFAIIIGFGHSFYAQYEFRKVSKPKLKEI